MKKRILIVLMLALTLTACHKDKPQSTVGLVKPTEESTESPTEPPTEPETKLNIENPDDSFVVPEIRDISGQVYEPVEVEINTEKTLDLEGEDLIEQARENQTEIESSKAAEREKTGETQSAQEIKETEIVTDEMHQELQEEINNFNQKQYEKMEEEAKKFEAQGGE